METQTKEKTKTIGDLLQEVKSADPKIRDTAAACLYFGKTDLTEKEKEQGSDYFFNRVYKVA